MSYDSALDKMYLETLESRRTKLCSNFATKAAKDPKHKHWFVPDKQSGADTRSAKLKYKTPLYRLTRYRKSPIPYLTDLLNT